MSRNIEKRLVSEISPLAEFLGVERVDDLKDKVCAAILDQIQDDLRHNDYVLIYSSDIQEIVDEAWQEVKNEVKKKLVDKYMADIEKAFAEGVKHDQT